MSELIVVATAREATGDLLAGRSVAVIDVLRATTVILTVLERGARRVVPVAEVDQARTLRSATPGALLAGERGGLPPPGFDYGNSPLEMARAELAGRLVVLTTTNGTLAVQRAGGATSIIAACLRNARAAAAELERSGGPAALLCAGTEGAFSIEDFYCAGVMASRLARAGWKLSDLAWAAALLASRPLEEAVNERTCAHVRTLIRRGLQADIPYCLSLDASATVPRYAMADTGQPRGFVLSGDEGEIQDRAAERAL